MKKTILDRHAEKIKTACSYADRATYYAIYYMIGRPLGYMLKIPNDTAGRIKLASSSTSKTVLFYLAQVDDIKVVREVAKSNFAPFYYLAYDYDRTVVKNVIENHSTPEDILQLFANSKESWCRVDVAKNIYTSSKILNQLSKDEDERVIIAVAQNVSTPSDVLDYLAKNEAYNVVYNVVRNTSILFETLCYLCKIQNHDYDDISNYARIEILNRLLKQNEKPLKQNEKPNVIRSSYLSHTDKNLIQKILDSEVISKETKEFIIFNLDLFV